jgi:hypothetical protein
VKVRLSFCVYIHTFIYIYTRRYRWSHVDTGYSCPETAVHPPAAVPLPRRGAPFGVDPGPGGPPGVSWPTANWPIPRLAPSMMTAPGNAPRAPPMAYRELASFRGHRCPRTCAAPLLVRPRSTPIRDPISLGQLAHPRTPSIPPRSPLLADDPGSRPPWPTAPAPTPTPARSGLPYGGPGPPRGVRGCGGRVQRSPSSSAAVELRPAHRLSHRLSGPRRPPLVRANAPVSGDASRGEGFAPDVGRPVWGIHLRLPTGRLTAHVPRQGRSPV